MADFIRRKDDLVRFLNITQSCFIIAKNDQNSCIRYSMLRQKIDYKNDQQGSKYPGKRPQTVCLKV